MRNCLGINWSKTSGQRGILKACFTGMRARCCGTNSTTGGFSLGPLGIVAKKAPVIVNTPTGPSNDLWDGVTAYEMGTYLNGVLGHVPDLIGRGPDGPPTRVIEVVVTSAPKEDYRTSLAKHGVELVEINVPDHAALSEMFVRAGPPYIRQSKVKGKRVGFAPTVPDYRSNRFPEGSLRTRQNHANSAVAELINNLRDCDPWYRRAFLELLREMKELDSLAPVFRTGLQSIFERRGC